MDTFLVLMGAIFSMIVLVVVAASVIFAGVHVGDIQIDRSLWACTKYTSDTCIQYSKREGR